jgi:hypothetical protein
MAEKSQNKFFLQFEKNKKEYFNYWKVISSEKFGVKTNVLFY